MIKKLNKYFTDKRILFFISVLGAAILIFWIVAAKTDWESTQTSLFRWSHWYFMDWFGELHRVQTGIYTGDDIANYPAFCFFIFRIFYSFLPENEGLIYDDFSIRATQSAVVPFAIFMIFLAFCFYHIFRYLMSEKTSCEREGIVVILLLSAPYVYVFERGNLIIIALVCTFLYVMLYDSEKKLFRVLSYVCLSVAAAIKLYPAVFGVLTLSKKRFKETILLVIMGAGTFFLPFFFFGGTDAIAAFFTAIMGSVDAFVDYGFGDDFSVYNLERLVSSLCNGYQKHASNISIIVIAICLIITFICVKELWQRLCVFSLAIILLPKFSYFYTVCFLAIPLLYLLRCTEKKIHYLYLVEFLLVYIPWVHIPLDEINYMTGEEASHLFGVGHICVYVGIISLLITLLIDGICQRTYEVRKKTVPRKSFSKIKTSKRKRRLKKENAYI